MAAAIARLSDTVDVIGIVALDNPLIRHAVVQAIEKGVRVFTLLSDMSIPQRTGYIGLDNQKAGRTAGWAVDRLCHEDGEIGIIVGDNRFICQESCEISFAPTCVNRAKAIGCLNRCAATNAPMSRARLRKRCCNSTPI